jgi:regulator of sigma E protease
MTILISILGLAFLILVHEAGHFFVALAVGMRPRSFNLGFGPPLLKVRRSGIDYAVRGIPLGGYVKIPGMHRPTGRDVDLHFGRAQHQAPELVGPAERVKRALDSDDYPQAALELDGLESALEDAGTDRASERGLTELRDAIGQDAYWRQPTWKRIAVIFAGPATNAILAIALFWALFASASSFYRLGFSLAAGDKGTTVTRVVESVLEDYPAAAIGLRRGDAILAVNGREVTPEQISEQIRASGGEPVTLTVLRQGKLLTLSPAQPVQTEATSVGEAGWKAVKLSGVVTRETVKALGRIVEKEGREQISSPVGIVRESSNAAEAGWESYVAVLGFISLSLALLNLLPLLPLDGGHILFSIIEGLRGRSVRREVYERVSLVGIALVLLLFFIGVRNDFNRLGG